MNKELEWKEKDDVQGAEAFGAYYQVWSDSSTGMKLWFWATVFGGHRSEGLSPTPERCRTKCEVHHSAMCAAIEEANPKWISVKERLPKSGSIVLIVATWKDGTRPFTSMALYAGKFGISCDEMEFMGNEDIDEENDRAYWPEGWYAGTAHNEEFEKIDHVTYWMPLPPAPESEGA